MIAFNSLSSSAQCVQFNSIFVDACNPPPVIEGENEMITFTIGAIDLSINDIIVTWPNNTFQGIQIPNAGTASTTDALNATITNSCGFLLEPLNDTLPSGANVLLTTSTNFSTTANSFANLADTMYIIYQVAGNTQGHFVNSTPNPASRTTTITASNSCNGSVSVTYDPNQFSGALGGDGATVYFDEFGNPTYVNNGCNAPVTLIVPAWSFTNNICQNYGDVDLNNLLAPNATTGGTWSGDGVTGNTFNPSGILGATSITYSVSSTGNCAETFDSTLTFTVDTIEIITEFLQACDSIFVNGNWFSNDTSFNFNTPGTPPYGCETINDITVDITGSIVDSSYIFACDSVEFNGVWYTSSVELRDTIAGGNPDLADCDAVFISEYLEGTGFNKAIEIYNGTGAPVDLSTYYINVYFNGSSTPGGTSPINLTGTLAPGETYVIVSNNANVDPALQALADQFSNGINFNGDDAVVLMNGSDTLDIFGNIGCQPLGGQWTDLGNGTADNSFIRQPDYVTGVTSNPGNPPCTFPSLNANNWISADVVNDFSNLGFHNSICGQPTSGGCDTIIITTIEIATPTIFDNIFLCTNEASEVGIVNDTLNALSGCDSLITITTTSLVSPTEEFTEACTNDPALVGNDTTSIILSALGCDSVYDITVSTLVTPTLETLPNIVGCEQVDFEGDTYTSSTTLNETIFSALGCDSVYREREIIVNFPVTVQNPNNPIIICETNDSTLLVDGTYAFSGGNYPVTFTNGAANGCDSTFVTVVETENCDVNLICDNDFTLGPDQNICFGESITLDAGSGYDTYEWQDGSENQTFTVNTSGTYYVTTTEIDFSNNLVLNGDFEQGNTGFTTDYDLGVGGAFGPLTDPGTYAISTSPSNVHNNFSNCGDQTTGSGNMFIANGADIANTNVWCQNMSILPNTDYIFSTWVTNALNDNNVSILQFSINNTQIGSDFSPTVFGCDWQQFNATWNSGTNTTAEICILSQNTGGGGNDFALDDIFFSPICSYSDTIEIEFSTEPTAEFNESCTNIAAEAGVFIDTISNSFGCDSIYNTLEVLFVEATENIISVECTNDELNAGIFIDTIFTNLGCDSVYNINEINFVDFATETFALEGCDSVRIGGITYYENSLSEDTILSALGCDSLIEVLSITVNESPVADAGEDETILQGESTTLTAFGGTEYNWNWIGGNSTEMSFEVSPNATTEYIVTVTENNCSDVDTVTIFVEKSGLEILIPNAFSPNGDGTNDVFQIVNAEFFNNIEMSIYNRWGELIHQGTDANHGWDGNYRGQDQAVGVYIYYARATSNVTGETFVLKGNVSLIR